MSLLEVKVYFSPYISYRPLINREKVKEIIMRLSGEPGVGKTRTADSGRQVVHLDVQIS